MALMRANGEDTESWRDAALWQRSRSAELSDDEAARFLDLAGFAERRLDADDEERVAEWLARDPAIASDIAIARALGGETAPPEAAPDAVLARACALVGGSAAPSERNVLPFAPRRRRPQLFGLAQWGSLAAAVVVAGWLGFTLGVDTSQSFYALGQNGDEGLFHELLDPSTGMLQDLTGGTQT